MLIFGNDDNDDNLELDFDGKKPTPDSPNSSLPTRPAPRNPFGSNSDQVDNLSPEKKSQGLPQRPSSPFGQASPSSRLPQRPVTEIKKPERPNVENSRTPVRPQPVPADPSPTPYVPSVPEVSNYLPPARKIETVEPVTQKEPDTLSESELYLRNMQEQAQQRAALAKEEEALRVAQSLPESLPEKISTPMAPAPEAKPVTEEKKKKKQGFFSPPPKTKKENTKDVAAKPSRERKYDGDRKKVLYIRLIAGTVAAVILVAGMNAIFNPSTGPSKAMVQSAAKEAVNYTGFPTTSGEQFALDFAKAYFNYDSTQNYEERTASLKRFASADLVKQIEVQKLSAAEYEAIKKNGVSYSQYNVSESISYGPYVVASKNVTSDYALFTVKVGLKSGSVLYYNVPVKYNPEKYSLTLAGPPSFTKPIDNTDEAPKEDWTLSFDGGSDAKLEESQLKDMEAYFRAWGASDDTIINRYVLLPDDTTTSTATDDAKRGLQGAVTFNKIIDLKIEPENKDIPATATQRKVEVNVLWEDPKTNLRYPQQYRMLIVFKENKWVVYDIQNFVTLNTPKPAK